MTNDTLHFTLKYQLTLTLPAQGLSELGLSQPIIDKPKVVSRSQSQKLTTWFSLKSKCPTHHPHPPTGKVSKKQDRAILPK